MNDIIHEFEKSLMIALGLHGRNVNELEVRCRAGQSPEVRVSEYIDDPKSLPVVVTETTRYKLVPVDDSRFEFLFNTLVGRAERLYDRPGGLQDSKFLQMVIDGEIPRKRKG